VTVSGPDRVGVGAELFAALTSLQARGIEITDVAQITIRGALVLCAEVSSRNAVTREVIEAALDQRDIVSAGITATVEAVTPSDVSDGRRLLVTFLAPRIATNWWCEARTTRHCARRWWTSLVGPASTWRCNALACIDARNTWS
jgi:predicted amino acid-binding ACT domain protein